jgi:hypothetical protein
MITKHTNKCGVRAVRLESGGRHVAGEHNFHINFGVATRGKHDDGMVK